MQLIQSRDTCDSEWSADLRRIAAEHQALALEVHTFRAAYGQLERESSEQLEEQDDGLEVLKRQNAAIQSRVRTLEEALTKVREVWSRHPNLIMYTTWEFEMSAALAETEHE